MSVKMKRKDGLWRISNCLRRLLAVLQQHARTMWRRASQFQQKVCQWLSLAITKAIAFQSFFENWSAGVSWSRQWPRESSLAPEHAAAGAFESACRMLQRQIGAANFEPLKQGMLTIAQSCYASFPGLPGASDISLPVPRANNPKSPAVPFSLKVRFFFFRCASPSLYLFASSNPLMEHDLFAPLFAAM